MLFHKIFVAFVIEMYGGEIYFYIYKGLPRRED